MKDAYIIRFPNSESIIGYPDADKDNSMIGIYNAHVVIKDLQNKIKFIEIPFLDQTNAHIQPLNAGLYMYKCDKETSREFQKFLDKKEYHRVQAEIEKNSLVADIKIIKNHHT